MKFKNRSVLVVFGIVLASLQISYADEFVERGILPELCGDMRNNYGPFDYTNYRHYTENLEVVELYHFTRDVETLTRGETGFVYGDLDYTLRAFPNHHRALASLSKFEFEVDNPEEQMADSISIDCLFSRAIVFKPMDGVVRLIYATYLHRKGLFEKAQFQYNKALEINPSSAEAHYNAGLFYLDTNQLSLAVKHGNKAYDLGYPLPGLKDKLIQKGVWDKTISQN